MTNRIIQDNGSYSKKELIEIIEEIDANKNQSMSSVKSSNHELPIHSNNHLISTSLKDLNEKYQNLNTND